MDNIQGNQILISCVGDDILPVGNEDIQLILNYFQYWFVTNLTFTHPAIGTRIIPMPIGIDFHTQARKGMNSVKVKNTY